MYLEHHHQHHHQNEEKKKSGFIKRQQQRQQQQLCCETNLLKQKQLYNNNQQQQRQQPQPQQRHYQQQKQHFQHPCETTLLKLKQQYQHQQHQQKKLPQHYQQLQQQQPQQQQHIQQILRSNQHKNNYKKHRKNRFNGIFQIMTSPDNDSSSTSGASENDALLSHSNILDASTIGIYELSAREAFGEDGACFFVVANVPQQRSRVVSSFIEDSIPQCSTTLLPPIQPSTPLTSSPSSLSVVPICMDSSFILNHTETGDLRVMTTGNNEQHSVSSGVGSVASSELDSPNPSTVSSSSSSSTNSSHSTTLLLVDNQDGDGGDGGSNNSGLASYREDNSLISSEATTLESTPYHKNNSPSSYCKDNLYDGAYNVKRETSSSFINNSDTNDSGCVVSFDDSLQHNTKNIRDSRRESGISSINSSSFLHTDPETSTTSSSLPILLRTSPTTTATSLASSMNNRPSSSIIDSDKEILLDRVKRDLFDPTKEQQMYHLKQILSESGCNTFTEQIVKSDWTPIQSRDSNNNQITTKPYIKSVLKKTRMTLLEEIQARHALKNKTLEAEAKREARVVCQLKRNELVKVIQQVRQCLRFTPCASIKLLERRPYFKCQFQIHQKIKLKRFPASHQLATTSSSSSSSSYWKNKNKDSGLDNIDSSSSLLKERLELADSLSCKAMKEAAGKGDIKRILNLMNSNECTHKNSSKCQTMPAFHNALQKEHFRTAILLLEAGTDLELYTEQRINEYNEMLEVVDRNRHAFNQQRNQPISFSGYV